MEQNLRKEHGGLYAEVSWWTDVTERTIKHIREHDRAEYERKDEEKDRKIRELELQVKEQKERAEAAERKVEKLTEANNRLTKDKANVDADNNKLKQAVAIMQYQLVEAKGTIAVWKTHSIGELLFVLLDDV